MRVLLMKNYGDTLIGEVTRNPSEGCAECAPPTPSVSETTVNKDVGHIRKVKRNLLLQPERMSLFHVCVETDWCVFRQI